MTPLGLDLSHLSRHAGNFASDRLPQFAILVFFLVAHLAVGSVMPYRFGKRPLLRQLADRLARWFGQRWNRAQRSPTQLEFRGALALVVMGGVATALGLPFRLLPAGPLAWIAEMFFISLFISAMGPIRVMREVIRRMSKQETGKAVMVLKPFFTDPLRFSDDYTLNRRALEFMAVEFNRGFFAPAVYYVLGGPALLALYVCLTAVHDSAARGSDYGHVPRLLQPFLDLPAAAAALLVAAAGVFVSGGSPRRALAVLFTQPERYDSRPRGWMVAAMAGALGVTLGGPVNMGDSITISRKWIGAEGSTARVSIKELERGRLLIFTSYLCAIVLFTSVFMAFLYFT